ncbi:MAG: IclR family transcriptional regulator [Clostridiaceae bacterium]|nr:IclR family transcriptional regulator [Clostridiaceae bacterium]
MNSTEKIIALLKKLGTSPYEHSLAELSAAAECGKSGTHKILTALIKEGFVIQKSDKKYCVGSAIHHLGKVYDENIVTWDICKPYMEELRDITGETVSLGIRENGIATIVHRVISREEIRLEGHVGKKLPVYTTAIGKLLAAYDDLGNVKKRLEAEPMVKRTPNTITEMDELLREYEKIRTQGYSISDEESTVGVVGIGAPLRDAQGKVWGCLCVGSPKFRVDNKKRKLIIELVVSAANKISGENLYF